MESGREIVSSKNRHRMRYHSPRPQTLDPTGRESLQDNYKLLDAEA